MSKLLTRAQILAAPVPTVEIESDMGTIRVRALSPRLRMDLLDAIHANERAVEDYEADQALPANERKGLPPVERYDQTVLTVLFTCVDEKGQRLFSLSDYPALCDLSLPLLTRLWEAMALLDKPQADLKKSLS